ncbi:MAG: response regulator transcription factor [Muribaculaceae bacterium]|nr:response regulator transcription factor [Muribaculaceae bacterium]MBP5314800.1 response regulator transcription factor [Muribaculaceae bacterium]
MNTEPIKVALVDDHSLFCLAMKALFDKNDSEIRIVFYTDDIEELLAYITDNEIDVILLDIIMPKVSGIEALRRIKAHDAEMPVVMLSASSSQDIIQEAIQNGADGFLSKQADVHEIISAATSAAEGVHYYGKDIAQLIYDIKVSKSDVHIQLSKREQEVVELCSEGLTCHEIAERLFISPRTIETHKNAIFKKLGIHNSVELVRYAINHGIISL